MLHHIEINVSDLQKSIEFWGFLLRELGYSEYQRWKNGISWRFAETYIVFVQAENEFMEIMYHRKRVGLNHLAFHADSREQVDELTNTLITRGVNVLYKDKHPFAGGGEHYAAFFEDPDRIKVELVASQSIIIKDR